MKKKRYHLECCDYCEAYIMADELLIIALVKPDAGLFDAWYIHNECRKPVEDYLQQCMKTSKKTLVMQTIATAELAETRNEVGLQLRRLIKESKQECSVNTVWERISNRLNDFQLRLNTLLSTKVEKPVYDEEQLDDLCNLRMLQKIFKLCPYPYVWALNNSTVHVRADNDMCSISTMISQQLAELINNWGIPALEAVIELQEAGKTAFMAVEQMTYMLETLNMSMEEAVKSELKMVPERKRRI
jgi:hypothetical protein